MGFKKTETQDLIYVSYSKETQTDYEQFKRELINATSLMENMKDIVVDLSGTSYIASLEIGVLVRIARVISGSTRMLRIIVSQEIKKILSATNFLKLGNLVVYDNQKAFFDELGNISGKK